MCDTDICFCNIFMFIVASLYGVLKKNQKPVGQMLILATRARLVSMVAIGDNITQWRIAEMIEIAITTFKKYPFFANGDISIDWYTLALKCHCLGFLNLVLGDNYLTELLERKHTKKLWRLYWGPANGPAQGTCPLISIIQGMSYIVDTILLRFRWSK